VAVGKDGTILTSPDGVSWTARTSGTSKSLSGVAYGNGTFVAVGGGGAILTSPDGVSWTARTSGTSKGLSGVAYGNGLFVAVGGGGAILTSPDGVTWTQRTSGTSKGPLRRGLRERPLRGGGEMGHHPHLPGRGELDSGDLGDGRLARGRDLRERPLRGGGGRRCHPHLPGRGDLDGVRTSGTSNDLYGVAYGNGTFVAVGRGGTILTSP
jgi:hypothetical protein